MRVWTAALDPGSRACVCPPESRLSHRSHGATRVSCGGWAAPPVLLPPAPAGSSPASHSRRPRCLTWARGCLTNTRVNPQMEVRHNPQVTGWQCHDGPQPPTFCHPTLGSRRQETGSLDAAVWPQVAGTEAGPPTEAPESRCDPRTGAPDSPSRPGCPAGHTRWTCDNSEGVSCPWRHDRATFRKLVPGKFQGLTPATGSPAHLSPFAVLCNVWGLVLCVQRQLPGLESRTVPSRLCEQQPPRASACSPVKWGQGQLVCPRT